MKLVASRARQVRARGVRMPEHPPPDGRPEQDAISGQKTSGLPTAASQIRQHFFGATSQPCCVSVSTWVFVQRGKLAWYISYLLLQRTTISLSLSLSIHVLQVDAITTQQLASQTASHGEPCTARNSDRLVPQHRGNNYIDIRIYIYIHIYIYIYIERVRDQLVYVVWM